MHGYLLPINWRLAKLCHKNPTITVETMERPLLLPENACFLPCACISNVIDIRDWLHATVLFGSFRLLGQWVTGMFQGIVLCFENALDLARFQLHWSKMLLTA